MLNSDFSKGADNALASILAVSGNVLTPEEHKLFREANPFGFILFKRNCDNPKQLAVLIQDLKNAVGRDCPILIDQEGGRVQRLRPPHWRDYKPMKYYGDLYVESPDQALEELRFETLRMAEELVEVGINVDCAPTLDLFFEGASNVIGDRSFSADPAIAARLGLSVCRHFLKSGLTPVIKHIPGHGRAKVDSHFELPRVESRIDDLMATDFESFKQLCASDVSHRIWAMTAHIVFDNIDTEHPVSVSKAGISLIRQKIGFKGILLSDDLDMKALDHYGSASDKALLALKAGCDVALYCAGDLKVMEKMAENLPKLSKNALKLLQNAAKEGTLAA